RVQQRLGGNAPAVQARSAYLVLLDQGYALAEQRGAQRAGIAAAAAAQHDDVVMAALCHVQLLYWRAHLAAAILVAAGLALGVLIMSPGGAHAPGSRPSAARSAMATSARTAAPVPPFGVYPYALPSLKAGPAMSRCAQVTPSGTNSRRN